MTSRKVRWAANTSDGSPIILDGVIAEVDDVTGEVSLNDRTAATMREVLANSPRASNFVIVPMADFPDEVHRVIENRNAAKVTSPVSKPSISSPETPPEQEVNPFQEIIDKTLRLVYSQEYRYFLKMFGRSPEGPSVDDLRHGPLGRDLAWLARIAVDKEDAPATDVYRAVNSVLELLFWPAGEDMYEVPPSFWSEPLGKMLSQAKFRATDPADLMSISNAAKLLDVSLPRIYRWILEGVFQSITDGVEGRTYVLRSDVEELVDMTNRVSESLSSVDEEEDGQKAAKVIVMRQPQLRSSDAHSDRLKALLG